MQENGVRKQRPLKASFCSRVRGRKGTTLTGTEARVRGRGEEAEEEGSINKGKFVPFK